MHLKKVSVIIPIYKGTAYISDLIRMLEDNWKSANKIEKVDIELVLVNDYPEDEISVDQKLSENITLIVISNKRNRGIHFSRVNGFLHSTGDYILFLDQDDEISPIYLKEQLKMIDGYDAVVCNGKNRGDMIYKNTTELNRAIDISQYKKGYNLIVSPGQVLIARESIPKEWLENILLNNGADDYFLWMLMLWKKCRVRLQEKILYWHMISEKSASNDLNKMNGSVLEMIENMVKLGAITKEEEVEIKKTWTIHPPKEEITIEKYQKEYCYRNILELWMTLRDRKISLSNYLKKKNLCRVVIYGAGFLGKHLYYELHENHIQVICFLDQNAEAKISCVDTLIPGAQLESIDAIIVTPFIEYIKIKKTLEVYYQYPIISIETILLNGDYELDTE